MSPYLKAEVRGDLQDQRASEARKHVDDVYLFI